MVDGERPLRPLTPVHERLAAGAIDEAVAEARRFLAGGASADRQGALVAAAALVALAEGGDADAVLARQSHHLPADQRRSLNAAAELTAVAEAASAGRDGARIVAALAGQALDIIETLGPAVAEQSGDYPQGSIMANVWMDGTGITTVGGRLASLFRATDDLEREARAAFMRAGLTTRVMGHYPHMVIPAMNDVAGCLRRMGRDADAAQYYAAVLGDFLWIPDEYAEDGEVPGDEDRYALERLDESCRGYLQTHAGDDAFDCERQLRTIREVLDRRPADDEDDEDDQDDEMD